MQVQPTMPQPHSALQQVPPRGSVATRRAAARSAVCCALAAALVGCADDADGAAVTLPVIRAEPLDQPLAGLGPAALQRFHQGDGLFDLAFRPADGLGPLYIRAACASCHRDGLRGPGAVTKLAPTDPSVEPAALLPWGPTLRPLVAGGGHTAFGAAPNGTHATTRLGPSIVGLGWLEAVDDQAIEATANDQAASGGPVRGLVARVPWRSAEAANPPFHTHKPGDQNLIGRFGYKARIATLDEFAADALQGDMGLTSPLRPKELPNPDGLDDDQHPGTDIPLETVHVLADYVRMLAIPVRAAAPAGGAALFAQVGCATCHVPALPTRADYPIAAIAAQQAWLYSDILLHDMGEGFDDGLLDGHTTLGVTSRHWRTAPLLAVSQATSYLHDGRAADLQACIAWHDRPGSEAAASAKAYAALSDDDRALLLAFVRAL